MFSSVQASLKGSYKHCFHPVFCILTLSQMQDCKFDMSVVII